MKAIVIFLLLAIVVLFIVGAVMVAEAFRHYKDE